MDDAELEAMVSQIEGVIDRGPTSSVPELPDFSDMLEQAASSSIDMLNDVELNVKIELGRAEMAVDDILKLNNGSVIELDKLAGDPVDVLVNEQLVARGEVLVINDNFCVRINEIVSGANGPQNKDEQDENPPAV
ncbi:MAG: flagellar motor switch protein FliN [Phycisphaerae bacterium]|nr:flagellar motor switch protein FliN [Phycisphaerae bacterium]